MRHICKRLLTISVIIALVASMGTAIGYAANYEIELSEYGTYTFPDRNVGYSTMSARSVTVYNDGDSATGRLNIDLYGWDADCFTLSASSLPSIARNGSASFTVRPKNGLSEGIYFAFVEVTGNGIFASFSVVFSVNRTTSPVGISLSQTGTYTFAEREVGYSQVSARSVTVRNERSRATGELDINLYGRGANDFVLSTSKINNISGNGSATFTIRPATGLSAGAYFATVEVTGEGGIFASFNVGFIVTYDGWWWDSDYWWWDSGYQSNQNNNISSGQLAGLPGLTASAATNSLRSVRPGEFATQGDAVLALYQLAGSPGMVTRLGQPLRDREAAYTWAVSKGIVPLSGTYELDSHITRQDAAFLLTRVADAMRLRCPAVRGAHVFSDESYIDGRAKKAVADLYMAGVFNGRDAKTFAPLGQIKRSDLATVLERFAGAVKYV